MLKKLTINVTEDVYDGLHKLIGKGNISRFLEDLARPHLTRFQRITAEDGYGCAKYSGEPVSDEAISRGLEQGIKEKWETR